MTRCSPALSPRALWIASSAWLLLSAIAAAQVPDAPPEPAASPSRQSQPPGTPPQQPSLAGPQSSRPSATPTGSAAVIEADPALPPFAADFVPRSRAILDDATLYDICHVGDRCWAVGSRGVILTSTDAGHTWKTAALPKPAELRCVTFLTDRIGWVCGTTLNPQTAQPQAVLRATRDGGHTWSDPAEPGPVATEREHQVPLSRLTALRQVRFFGLDTAIAIGSVGEDRRSQLLHSADGGRSWVPLDGDAAGAGWQAAAFLNALEGVVAGEALSFGTLVGRKVVTLSPPGPTLRSIHDVRLETDRVGWMAGDGGLLMSTVDSGITWQVRGNRLPPAVRDMFDFRTVARSGSTVVAAGTPGSCVIRSPDNGETWMVHPLPGTVPVSRLRFTGDQSLIAVGTLGSVTRSDDGGVSWQSVRGGGRRAGLLQFVTEPDASASPLLTRAAGNDGIRSAVVQLSPDISPAAREQQPEPLRVRQVVTGLGGNAFERDWRFVRSAPEQHLTPQSLRDEWNRATDGQLDETFPLRVACLLRMWRPTVVVLEPANGEDAVADATLAALPQAIRLAAGADETLTDLDAVLLPPWTVPRVLIRSAENRTTPLTFRRNELLPSLGTSLGLIREHARRMLDPAEAASGNTADVVSYELALLGRPTANPASLFGGLREPPGPDARRAVTRYRGVDPDALEETLTAAQIESAALRGHTLKTSANDSIIAHVTAVGADLPEALARQQLRFLAELNRDHQNFDGWIAVLQEVTRRFPDSADARAAAEQLFLYYSSAEMRHLRVRAMQQAATQPAVTGIPSRSELDESLLDPQRRPPITMQPNIEPAAGVRFSAAAGDQVASLLQTWDRKAQDNLLLLNRHATTRTVAPRVLLRHAANLRLAGRTGEQSSLLGELSGRGVPESDYSRAEMQAGYAATAPVIPTVNLMLTEDVPWLNATLDDACWVSAEEIRLTDSTMPPTSRHGDSLIMAAWDQEFLYLSGRIEHVDPDSASVPLAIDRAHDAEHGALDRVEFAFDLDRDYATRFTFVIDQTGRTSESCWGLTAWNPKWYVASDSGPTAWRFEVAIPFAELSPRPARPGDLWTATVRRIRPGILQQTLSDKTTPRPRSDGVFLIRFIRARR